MDSATAETNVSPLALMLRNPAVRQLVTLVGIAVSMALGVVVILALRSPNYVAMYNDLSETQNAEIANELANLDVPFRLRADGTVTVPEDRKQEARMALASRSLPSPGIDGMNMLREEADFGVSQFVERKRYNHALETELALTIAKLEPVRFARVHLAIAKDSVFVRERGRTSASVLLDLKANGRLSQDQVEAIVYLVARSINGLEADQVTVLDQTGRMLNSPENDSDYAMTQKQFDYRRRIENDYVRRIEDLLTPIVGHGRVRAKVDADLDFTVREQTQESFDPNSTVLRSENTRFNERRGGAADAQGIPGALSNQPPVAGNDGATADPADQLPPVNTSQEAVRNFEVDRTISRTRQPTGEIRRLSVAVIVDHRYTTDPEGNTTSAPRSDAELDQIRALVREAVGFDAQRGDRVELVNSSFEQFVEVTPPEEPKIWEKPMFRDLLKLGIGSVLILTIIFGLLRPMSRSLLQAAAAPALPGPQIAGALPGGGVAAPAAGAAQVAGELSAPAQVPVEQRVDAARKLAAEDPQRVASVVKEWVAEDG